MDSFVEAREQAALFDVNRHNRNLYRLCKHMQAAWNVRHLERAKLFQRALERELSRRPAWYVCWLQAENACHG